MKDEDSHINSGFELEEASKSPENGNGSFENVDLTEVQAPPDSTKMPVYDENETRRMTKNIIVVSIGFLLLFTAYSGLSNVLSSLYPDDGLGTYTNATVYVFMVFSSIFVPSIAMRQFSVKWSLVISMFGYVTAMGAQYYPRFYTMIPASAIVGLCAAPLWASKSFYLTHLGGQYASLIGDKAEIIIIRFFGIFFMFFQTATVWGGLISSTIFSSGVKKYPNASQIEKCGIKFCPGDLESSNDEDDDDNSKIYIFAGVCLACAFSAIALVSIFMDPLTRYGENERIAGMKRKSGMDLIMATTRQMKNPYQILIIPLTIFSGLEQGFLGTDFTQSFITCAWGLEKVGYVLICYGCVDSFFSISFGPIVRNFGRLPVYTLGALINLSMVATMMVWRPDPENQIIFFVIVAFWGAADAVWQTQINSLYGILFTSNEEAAFSNYRLWESLGFIIAYVEGGLLCVRIKLIVLVVVLLIGMTGFYVIEYKEYKRKKNDAIKIDNDNDEVEEKM